MKEANALLLDASHEIKQLRRANELLHAKVEVIDIFACAMGMKRESGASPDVVWAIDKYLRENS